VDDCIIDGNEQTSVIRFEEDLGGIIDATTLITGFTVRNGNAQADPPYHHTGGGMYLKDSNPTLTGLTFSDNTASTGGGMALHSSSPTLTDVTFSDNTGATGGGMSLHGSSSTLTNVTFTSNTFQYGGGMYLSSSSPTLIDVTFNGNTGGDYYGSHYGGGMHLSSSSPTLMDVTFSDNTAYYGGGMYLWNSSNPTLINVTFSDNTGGMGGGMCFESSSNSTLTNVTFSNNTASWGGGIFIDSSSPSLTGVTFSDNTAIWGGGMHLWNSSNPTLTNVILNGNSASSKGGGIYFSAYLSGSSIIGSYVLINNNYSHGHGAGIFISADCNANLSNSTIASNMVGEGDTFGAGIYVDGGTATLVNSIVYYNRREGDYGINYNLNGYTMDILNEYTVSYSDIEGDENWIPEGMGNISIAPEVNDFENGDFTLQSTSPCIDAGDPESELDPDGTRADMGAYSSSYGTPLPIVRNVPSEYSTIQSALTAASEGDTVLVQPGTYYENIIWPETNGIKLISAGDSSNTVIDGGGGENVVIISVITVIDTTTKIQGFKIINWSDSGNGLNLNQSNIHISMLSFEGNTQSNGNCIKIRQANSVIIEHSNMNNANIGIDIVPASATSNTLIVNNQISNCSTGIYIDADGNGNLFIGNNIIKSNVTGIWSYKANPTIYNNIIVNNNLAIWANAGTCGGGNLCGNVSPTIRKNTIAFNTNYTIIDLSNTASLVDSNIFYENTGFQLIKTGKFSPTLNQNSLLSISDYIIVAGENNIDAKNNWWGGIIGGGECT